LPIPQELRDKGVTEENALIATLANTTGQGRMVKPSDLYVKRTAKNIVARKEGEEDEDVEEQKEDGGGEQKTQQEIPKTKTPRQKISQTSQTLNHLFLNINK
jgi:CO dehydrogenase/acetyl-CoA synthase beta subunit